MKGFRTLVFNGVMALLALLATTGVIKPEDSPDPGVVNGALDHAEAIIAVVTPIGNAILRFFTTGPVATKV